MSTTLDLRNGQSPVKDQGRRGTCVACAATAGHEMLRAEDDGLCIEFLHWASKQRDGLPGNTEGTTLPAAAAALAEVGQPLESTWPYDEHRDQWDASYRPPADACATASVRRLTGERLAVSTTALRGALDRGRAVLLGVRLYHTWFEVGPDGRIVMPSLGATALGGHAVLVVGYDDDALIIRNSWGSDWGEEGYAFLPEAYVEAYGVAAWAASR